MDAGSFGGVRIAHVAAMRYDNLRYGLKGGVCWLQTAGRGPGSNRTGDRNRTRRRIREGRERSVCW